MKVVATYHTKLIKKKLKAKSKECVQKLEASEKRKTKENTIVIAGHKDEMSKLVKSHEKDLHVRTIFMCVPLAHIGFFFACVTLTLCINCVCCRGTSKF